jgi:acetaldehyde dehydrogenase (acetylating)
VGKPATLIAAKAGITVPPGTRALIAPLAGVGRDFPLSIEKLCPVLSYYVVRDWREGCERCKEILRYGGMGHTMSIHSRNEQVILEFGLHKPAYRICVNTPTTHGSIGLTTGLDPAMTLGCGGFGGNITSDNISPKHLLNIKRLAYEIRPAQTNRPVTSAAATATASAAAGPRLPQSPARATSTGISGDALSRRIDQFLLSRGFTPAASGAGAIGAAEAPAPQGTRATRSQDAPVDFVCEDDVRRAIQNGSRIALAERSIITPAARELGESHNIFDLPGVTLPR